jgi:hypothetical protein
VSDEDRRLSSQADSSAHVGPDDPEDGGALVVDFRRCAKELVAGELAKALSAAVEDGRLVGLGQEEKENDEGESGDPEKDEERPPPVLVLGSEASDDGSLEKVAKCQRQGTRRRSVAEEKTHSNGTQNGTHSPASDSHGKMLHLEDVYGKGGSKREGREREEESVIVETAEEDAAETYQHSRLLQWRAQGCQRTRRWHG